MKYFLPIIMLSLIISNACFASYPQANLGVDPWNSFRPDVKYLHQPVGIAPKGSSIYQFKPKLYPALVKPRLALSYSSFGSLNPELPHGWSLEGILEIIKRIDESGFEKRLL